MEGLIVCEVRRGSIGLCLDLLSERLEASFSHFKLVGNRLLVCGVCSINGGLKIILAGSQLRQYTRSVVEEGLATIVVCQNFGSVVDHTICCSDSVCSSSDIATSGIIGSLVLGSRLSLCLQVGGSLLESSQIFLQSIERSDDLRSVLAISLPSCQSIILALQGSIIVIKIGLLI